MDRPKYSCQFANLVGEVLIRGLMDYHLSEEHGKKNSKASTYRDPRVDQAKAWVEATGQGDDTYLTFEYCCEVMSLDPSTIRSIVQCDERRPLMYQRLRRATTSYRTSKSLKRSYRKRQEEAEVMT